MTARVRFDEVNVGTALPERTFHLRRADLVRYAGASGDFNPIHWNDRVAAEVGLPGVIAHGMLTMAKAAQAVTDWLGDPGAILEVAVRFTRPVLVPDDDEGATLLAAGRVVEKFSEDHRAKVELTVHAGEDKVLGRAQAIVRLR
ncbi:MAG: MaoC/PaaZ C-terminal domain-containing protein [Actinomycetes bacterium]